VSTLLWGMLSGGVGDLIKLTNKNPNGTSQVPGGATANIAFNSNGELTTFATGPGLVTHAGEWMVTPNAVPSGDYEIRATRSGSGPGLSGSALDTWLALSTTRSWALSAATGGYRQANLEISIRQVATGAVLATANVLLEIDSGNL
jgi:hypothetical protein